MTVDEWRAKVAADRPPLSAAQVAALRPVAALMLPHMNAAPVTATTEAAPAMSAPHYQNESEDLNGQR